MAAFLIIALVIAITATQNGVTAMTDFRHYDNIDQVAEEAKNRAVTIIDGPKYVAPPLTSPVPVNSSSTEKTTYQKRPSSQPPNSTPDKHGKTKYIIEIPHLTFKQIQNLPSLRSPYSKPLHIHHPNSVYKYHKVVPAKTSERKHQQRQQAQQPVFAASTIRPSRANNPKFSLPVETINGIRADFVLPPQPPVISTTTTSTTTSEITTARCLRTKRIWPIHVLEQMKTYNNTRVRNSKSTANRTDNDLSGSSSHHRYVYEGTLSSTAKPISRGSYRPVTRMPKIKSTTRSSDFSSIEPNDWVPIVPPQYSSNKIKVRQNETKPVSRRSKREVLETSLTRPSNASDRADIVIYDLNKNPSKSKRPIIVNQKFAKSFLNSYGAVPSPSTRHNIYHDQGRQLKQHSYSGSRRKPVAPASNTITTEYQADDNDPRILMKIKHHHHHHHHRYVKTVEKPIKVEVAKPVPVGVPMPVPVQVEKKIPYPVKVQVPHPVPVKVVEKEYVPKPYPVYQQIVKHVPVQVPVQVPVPQPYPVHIEKRVPYPVPVRVLVPQPYPVKEPVEVVKQVKVAVPQPYPVKVPYPVEVEKRVPMPFRVLVPEKVEVERKVPVYVPKPYLVEKKIHVPVKIPVPVKVPIKVPVGIPIIIHPKPVNEEIKTPNYSNYAYSVNGNHVTQTPEFVRVSDTISFHGNTMNTLEGNTANIQGIRNLHKLQSRSDQDIFHSTEVTTTPGSNETNGPSTVTTVPTVKANTENSTEYRVQESSQSRIFSTVFKTNISTNLATTTEHFR